MKRGPDLDPLGSTGGGTGVALRPGKPKGRTFLKEKYVKVGIKFGMLAVAALSSLSAFGVVRPGWERPVAKAELSQIEGDGRYPRPTTLTKNKQDGAKEATSFTLVEDTGLRCITTPCPSHKTTVFHVLNVKRARTGRVEYTASTDKPFLVGIIAPKPGHVVRKITVIDYTNDTVSDPKYTWILKLKGKNGMQEFGGNPEPAFTPAGR
jgi:hypothetical protein